MESYTSKVYIKTDERHNIITIDGGYTMANIVNPSEWILFDEGYGDRFNLCQNNYLPKPIMDEHGLYRYAYIDGEIVEKDLTEEIAALEEKRRVEDIRRRREEECFSVINRGTLWYQRLTDAQKEELESWYDQWLDAPETNVIPEKPVWI